MNQILSERPPRERLGLFFLIWSGCFLFFSLLSQGFLLLYLGKDAYQQFTSGAAFTPQMVEITRYLQILLSIGIFGVPPLVFVLLSKPRDWSLLSLNRVPKFQLMALTVLLVAFSLPVVTWALEVNQGLQLPAELESQLRAIEERNAEFLKMVLTMNNLTDFLLNFLMIAIIPPIVEELLFRGALQQLIQKQTGPHVAIILAGAFFSMIHMEFYGFFPRFLLGVMLGYLFYWSGSLWVPIFAHFLHNGVQVLLLYLYQRGAIDTDIEQMESFPPYVTMGATILFFVTLYIFDRAANNETPQDGEKLGESTLDK